MRGLPAAETRPTTRIRRWDAVILGGALPGLVAAVRLGLRGARVLVLEEEGATGSREPFWISGAEKHSVLGACLRALSVPLIDQRRIEPDPLAFQMILPEARLDLGEPRLTVDEWVAWGFAKPEEARSLVLALSDAATAEREALLEAPIVRGPRRLPRAGRRPGGAVLDPGLVRGDTEVGRPPRGLPAELAAAPARLAFLLAAQTRALSNLGATQPSDAARARLLGAPLEGGAAVRGDSPWLCDILRRRIESLYGEFRSVPEVFRLVSAGGQPGVAPDAAGESSEIWVGRVFVLNAPREALAAAVTQDPVPEILRVSPARRRRVTLRFRAEHEALPEPMAARVIVVRDESLPPDGPNVVTLRRFPPDRSGSVELLASAVVAADETDLGAHEAEISAALTGLMPFAKGRLERVRAPEPRWDHDALLADPPAGSGWPAEIELRLPTKQPIYQLDRAAVGGLGFEGDTLLGWRGGDAIAADLA
jgi:hypothetical protein